LANYNSLLSQIFLRALLVRKLLFYFNKLIIINESLYLHRPFLPYMVSVVVTDLYSVGVELQINKESIMKGRRLEITAKASS